ncbi:hypothetical protein A2V61_04095 [Candidatus Woesebacteria bacterium RBG_19FT_COMBO_47_8]|uniref:PABS domain-containing protein n=1 Tax=Candidatus Woesebacteria bacterium RBG_13_46_13 TaxID=1802479 RepID=A0A1F7X5J3_9BACT|nr:MAG: hypothetical protein A2Y68_02770 [Candidatus Woesebacteria bacterium RBG_13_46_13]OGM16579.1 MAG: hypothetical protein A2V61_04095 [Candidatus Woesebacteria bacterium RBG_19FT_COMBO_47_8]HJX59078.1 methyltransferase domain-containing protein [Patescibacteria group bacterium]
MLGTKVIEEVRSALNGKIEVVKSVGFGTYIKVEGLTQSGGVVYEVWQSTLKKVKGKKLDIQRSLILGLGGGSAAKLVKKYWREAKITGVDIDPVMVRLGEKYLDLKDVEIRVEDAEKFIGREVAAGTKYDLILIDMYIGDTVPEKFQSDKFIKTIHTMLGQGGVAIFNRLYFGEKRSEAVKFGNKLEKAFLNVEYVYPEANLMFVCLK